MKALLWKLLHPSWKKKVAHRIPGYTLLLPEPGDLPIFLKIATKVCSKQNMEGLIETLVIPDKLTPEICKTFEQCQREWPEGKLRLAPLNWMEETINTVTKNPGHITWLQLVKGVEETKTTHALLHDSDLFVFDSQMMKKAFETCSESRLSCLGVSKVWDPWFKKNGFSHLVATWELMFSLEWIQQFPPWKHHGQRFSVFGQSHICDTTLWPQCQTPPEQIKVHDQEQNFVHFNYVLSTYRLFQNAPKPYEDSHFRLLLIRLFQDLYGEVKEKGALPSHQELIRGLSSSDAPVTYLDQKTKDNYIEFRQKLEKLFDSPFLSQSQRKIAERMLEPFDRKF